MNEQINSNLSVHDATAFPHDGEALPTKTCPRCGQELFADMTVCYGCLYDFSREHAEHDAFLPDPALGEADSTLTFVPEVLAERPAVDARQDVVGKRKNVAAPALRGGLGLFVQTGDVDLTVPLPARGLMVGRLPTNDIVLHSRAVSKQHVLVVPSGGGAVVEDQGSTNLAILRGREVAGSRRMSLGDTLSICGTLLTLVDEPPSLPDAS